MGHVIPSRNSTLVQIFKEKVPGSDQHLISQELIAYLKWLIHVAAYNDRSTLAHAVFYQKQVLLYQNPANYKMWRSQLYKELDEWYKEHLPSKKRKIHGAALGNPIVVVNSEFKDVDYLDVVTGAGGGGAPAAGVALAAAASPAAAAPGAVGGPVQASPHATGCPEQTAQPWARGGGGAATA
jgi:hypothetical protein